MKRCPTCQETKPLDLFWKGQYLCIPCQKEKQRNVWKSRSPKMRLSQHLKYKYGISHADFMEQWGQQQGRCCICAGELPDLMVYESRRRGYAIDHNHETKEFRGILCLSCNSMLGMAKESPEVLEEAARYLRAKGNYASWKMSKTEQNGGQ